MIENSRFQIVYYKANYTLKGRSSGTKITLAYAEKKMMLFFIKKY